MRIETDSQHYTDIAEAIRDMNGTENAYYPEEMASEILAIPQETYNVFAPIIYSLEEREVGVWTDEKPLYQRVFEFTNALTIPSSSWTLTNIDSTNIEKIVYCAGIHSDGTCYAFIGADPTQSTHSKVGVWSTRNSNITLKGLVLQYTKISDIAGSGSWGTDSVPMVHYDGTERIIGTWFGETLYETVVDGLNISIPSNWGTEFITSLSIKDAISAKFWDTSNSTNPIMLSIDEVQVLNGGIRIRSQQSDIVNYRHITRVVIQYTKTSS